MADVCVITGGGSGMGLAAAKYMPKEKILVLAGRTEAKLQRAIEELKAEGHEAYAKACDTSKRESVRALAEYAASLGEVKNVINSAGLSPNMAEAETILRVNALGTVYMNEEFSKVRKAGSVIVDVASNSAYVLPGFLISKKVYALADQDERLFLQKMLKKCRMAKEGYARNGMAYAFSKNFVVWYAKKCAFAYGKGNPCGFLEPRADCHRHGQSGEGGGRFPDSADCRGTHGKAGGAGFCPGHGGG